MSVGVDPCMPPTSGTLSCYVTAATAVAAAITFSASGAAPTLLYHEYQEHFGLTEVGKRNCANRCTNRCRVRPECFSSW